MANRQTDVLIFVEDPGAANYVAGMPNVLAERGCTARIVATGHAAPQLRGLECAYIEVDEGLDAARVIDDYTPRLVVSGTSENPDTLGLKLISEARRRGLPSVGVVDGPASADRRFRGGGDEPLGFAPDWIVVADGPTRRSFIEAGHPEPRVVECGHPHFDRVVEERRQLAARSTGAVRRDVLADAPPDRPVWVFLAEVSDGLDPAQHRRRPDYTLAGRDGSDKRVDIVLEEFLDALSGLDPRPYVVLRLHPKNDVDEFAAYNGEIDRVSRTEPAHALVFAADLVVGLTTILLFEAAVLGCPTLAIVPRQSETAWLTSVGLGLTQAVWTREDLRRTLAAALNEPETLRGKPPQEMISFGALDRVADVVEDILAEKDG